jgi:hypothetical protein
MKRCAGGSSRRDQARRSLRFRTLVREIRSLFRRPFVTPRRSNARQCSDSAVKRTLREVAFGFNNRHWSFVTKQRRRLPAARGQRSNNQNANIAIDPGRIEQNFIIAAPYSHVDGRLTELQVAQDDLIQKCRQARIAQPDFAIERIEL